MASFCCIRVSRWDRGSIGGARRKNAFGREIVLSSLLTLSVSSSSDSGDGEGVGAPFLKTRRLRATDDHRFPHFIHSVLRCTSVRRVAPLHSQAQFVAPTHRRAVVRCTQYLQTRRREKHVVDACYFTHIGRVRKRVSPDMAVVHGPAAADDAVGPEELRHGDGDPDGALLPGLKDVGGGAQQFLRRKEEDDKSFVCSRIWLTSVSLLHELTFF